MTPWLVSCSLALLQVEEGPLGVCVGWGVAMLRLWVQVPVEGEAV